MAHSDKRSVSTDALETLGTIIDARAGRDAIHLAVEPATAGERLLPGQHIGLMNGKAHAATGGARDWAVKKLGIVDPFLAEPVEKGQKFWLVVYPRQISSLRHVWTHPDFVDEAASLVPQAEDQEILQAGAGAKGIDYFTFMSAISEYITDRERGDDSKYIYFNTEIEYGDLPVGFWGAYERVTGRSVPESFRDVYFRCAC